MLTDGIPIRTGFVTVTENPATNYGLRFTQSLSAIAYPGQRAAAVLNVALPSIAIEFVDSLHRFDSTDSSAVIVATTSSGTLDPAGTTQRVSRGRVTFSSLVFRSIADDPTLTFTVFGTNLPVVGKSLAFGPIQMSTLPIPASQLRFSAQNTDNNNVTYAFKGLTFSNGTDPTVVASVVVADSAGQLSTPSEVASVGPITVQVTSDEAVFDGPATVTVDPTSVCACANFSNTITAYKDGIVGGSPIYLRYTVVEAAGLLRGKVVVAGPIFATDLPSATAASSCSASVVAKKVIAEFRMPRTVFEARNVTQELALLLGVLPARIQIERSTLKEVIRVDPKTLMEWTGTKAVFTFTDPLETSSNRKSSSELADEFVTLRPNCDAVSLELAAVYTEAADRSCDKDAFELSLAKTKDCVTAGTDDLCRCYATGVIAEWGQTCSEDVSLRETLTSICRQLATCQDAETQNVCDNLLPPQAVNLVWLWGTLGAVGGVGLMVLAANSQGFFRGKQKTTLGNF